MIENRGKIGLWGKLLSSHVPSRDNNLFYGAKAQEIIDANTEKVFYALLLVSVGLVALGTMWLLFHFINVPVLLLTLWHGQHVVDNKTNKRQRVNMFYIYVGVFALIVIYAVISVATFLTQYASQFPR